MSPSFCWIVPRERKFFLILPESASRCAIVIVASSFRTKGELRPGELDDAFEILSGELFRLPVQVRDDEQRLEHLAAAGRGRISRRAGPCRNQVAAGRVLPVSAVTIAFWSGWRTNRR